VLVGVHLRGVFVVLGGMQVMPMRHLGVMRGLFVMASLVVLCRFAMVLGRMIVMVRGLLMVLVDFVAVHYSLPG
jgi:hypothetical protein